MGKPKKEITERMCINYVKKHGLPKRIDFAMLTVYAYPDQPKGFKKPIGAVRAALRKGANRGKA